MIYLIGGPARCGKSSLAKRVRKHLDGHVISGDAFVSALHGNLEPRWIPDLFEHTGNDALEKTQLFAEKVDRLRRRDKAAWSFYESYLGTAIEDSPDEDVLIEGNLWPDFIHSLVLPHKAVFLVDTSPAQSVRLKKIRDENGDNDWMENFSDEEIEVWAAFNAARSKRYVTLCEKFGYSYFDIAKQSIEEASGEAFHALLQKRGYNSKYKA